MRSVGYSNVLVLVPCYNESQSIRTTLESLLRLVPHQSVLVIDDGSADESAAIAGNMGINVLMNPTNIGRNKSIAKGIDWGMGRGFELFICLDADGQHPPEGIPRILRHAEQNPGIDCIVMSRFRPITKVLQVPLIDALGIVVTSFLVSMSSGTYISDPTTGYIAFSKRAAACLASNIERLSKIASDNTWGMVQYPLFSRYGFHTVELPSSYIARASGGRKMFSPLRRFLYPLWLLKAFVAVQLALGIR